MMLILLIPRPYTEKTGPELQCYIYNFYSKIKRRGGSLEYYKKNVIFSTLFGDFINKNTENMDDLIHIIYVNEESKI